MTVGVVNVVGALLLGACRISGEQRLAVSVLASVASFSALLLGRLEALTSFRLGDVQFTLLRVVPFVLLPIWLGLVRRCNRLVKLWHLFALLVVVHSLLTLLACKGPPAWTIRAVAGFIGPLLLGTFAATLRTGAAKVLSQRLHFLVALVGVLTVLSVMAGQVMAGFFGWNEVQGRAFSPLGGPIATGAVLLLVWPSMIWKLFRAPDPWRMCEAMTVLLAFLLSGSRAVVLAALLQLVAIIGLLLFKSPRTVGVFILVVIFLCASHIAWFVAGPTVERLTVLPGSAWYDQPRVVSLTTAMKLLMEEPLFGRGAGQVYPWFTIDWGETVEYAFTTVRGHETLVEPHNLYLMMAVEYGLVVLAAFLLILGWTVWLFIRTGWKHNRLSLIVGSIGILGFLGQALGSSHLLVNERVASIFWLYVGSLVPGAVRLPGMLKPAWSPFAVSDSLPRLGERTRGKTAGR